MVAITALGAVLAFAGGIGFLVSVAAMARAVGIPTPDARWRSARRAPAAQTTEQALDALGD